MFSNDALLDFLYGTEKEILKFQCDRVIIGKLLGNTEKNFNLNINKEGIDNELTERN